MRAIKFNSALVIESVELRPYGNGIATSATIRCRITPEEGSHSSGTFLTDSSGTYLTVSGELNHELTATLTEALEQMAAAIIEKHSE